MEVRDIFALRKEGKVEEAYKLISEKYATYHGRHTTMCMFWCTDDMLRKALGRQDYMMARRYLFNMTKIYPAMEGVDHRAVSCIVREAVELDRHVEDFNLIYFMPYFLMLKDADWLQTTIDNHKVPSLGQQVVNHLMKGLDKRDAKYINAVSPLFEKAYKLQPRYKENRRHLAQMKVLLGNQDEAIAVYRDLLRHYHDSYLYAELAELLDDDNSKVALLAQAIMNQRMEKFSTGYHFSLALLLEKKAPARSAYEIEEYFRIITKVNGRVSSEAERLRKRLKDVQPVDSSEETAFYKRAGAYAKGIIG